jgi:predicted transcriptional regulator
MNIKQTYVKDIQNLLISKPTCINKGETGSALMKALFEDPRTRHVYVTDDNGVMVGTVRLNSLVEFMAPYIQNLENNTFNVFIAEIMAKKVETIMRKDFLSLAQTTSLIDMIGMMVHHGVNELPILDSEGRVTGEANLLELIKFLSDNEHIAINKAKGASHG